MPSETSNPETSTTDKKSCKDFLFGKQFRRNAFYFVLLFLATMTIIDVSKLVIEYIQYPKKANMDIVFNDTITFPQMTFCMSKEQAWSHFKMENKSSDFEEYDEFIEENLKNITDKDAFLKSPWDYRMVIRSYEAIATLNSLERESTWLSAQNDIKQFAKGKGKKRKLRHLVKHWLDVIKKRNITFEEFQQKVGLETLRRSLRGFSRLSYNDENDEVPAKVKITWLSLTNLCFQPTLTNGTFDAIEEQGQIFRIVLLHNIENLNNTKKTTEDDDCMSLDMHGRPTTLARNMEGKGRVKDGISEELCVGQNHEVQVDIRASYIMLPNNEKPTACRNYDEGDESEFDCRSRCRMEMIRQACHCTALTLHYLSDEEDLEAYPICDYEACGQKTLKNFTDKICADKCLPDCKQTRYDVETSQKGRSVRPGWNLCSLTTFLDLTRVTIYWGTFEYLKLEQEYVWTMASFIAALGGSLGMWLGLSMLSLIQFITYLASKLTKKVNTKRSFSSPTNQRSFVGPSMNTIKTTTSSEPNSRKTSFAANPFGGPVAINPFNSPYAGKHGVEERKI